MHHVWSKDCFSFFFFLNKNDYLISTSEQLHKILEAYVDTWKIMFKSAYEKKKKRRNQASFTYFMLNVEKALILLLWAFPNEGFWEPACEHIRKIGISDDKAMQILVQCYSFIKKLIAAIHLVLCLLLAKNGKWENNTIETSYLIS